MGDAGIKSAIQGSNVPNPDEAVPSFVSGAMAKAGKGLLEGTLQAGTSAVSDKLLDLVGLGGKSAADKGTLNCSRLPCVYAQETLTFLLTQKKTCVKNYVQKESGSAGMPRPISYAVFCLKKKTWRRTTDVRNHINRCRLQHYCLSRAEIRSS